MTSKKISKTGNKRLVSTQTQRELFIMSGNSCAICGQILAEIDDNNIITYCGNMAHIVGLKKGSARFDETKDEKYLNSFENIIIVCANCHTKIDTNVSNYTVKKLKKLKETHEKNVLLQANGIVNRASNGGWIDFSTCHALYEYMRCGEEPNTQLDEDLDKMKHLICQLKDLNIDIRRCLLIISKSELQDGKDNNLHLSYFETAYGDQDTKLLTPLETRKFINLDDWRQCSYDDDDPELAVCDHWCYILSFLQEENISLGSVIIDRDFSVFD